MDPSFPGRQTGRRKKNREGGGKGEGEDGGKEPKDKEPIKLAIGVEGVSTTPIFTTRTSTPSA